MTVVDSTDHRIAGLDAGTRAVLAAFDGLSGDDLDRRPRDGEWSAWQIAYHLFDIERWYIAKLCEAMAPDRATALERFMAIWRRLREESVELARAIPEERLDEAGLLQGVPDWTPRGLIEAMAVHDADHAAQARAAVAGEEGHGRAVDGA
jgi:hypothetical protein